MRILIVDDESSIRRVLRIVLERAGHEVSEAANGADALERISAARPELMLTDVMMPVMDGRELIARLRADAQTSSIAIVVVTSERGLDGLPVEGVVLKPFLPDDILAAIGSLSRADV